MLILDGTALTAPLLPSTPPSRPGRPLCHAEYGGGSPGTGGKQLVAELWAIGRRVWRAALARAAGGCKVDNVAHKNTSADSPWLPNQDGYKVLGAQHRPSDSDASHCRSDSLRPLIKPNAGAPN
jgi:hypothetical protein